MFPRNRRNNNVEAGEIILDAGWAVLSSADTDATKNFCDSQEKVLLDVNIEDVRAVRIETWGKKIYFVIANFGEVEIQISLASLIAEGKITDMASQTVYSDGVHQHISLLPNQAKVFLQEN